MNDKSHKSFTFYDNNYRNRLIYDHLCSISRNIYNTSIFCIQIFSLFKNKILSELYLDLQNKKVNDANIFIIESLCKYHEYYCSIREHLNKNNKLVYTYIINYIKMKNVLLDTSNYETHKKILLAVLKKNKEIYLDNKHNDILFDNIFNTIMESIYNKNYRLVKDDIDKHKKLDPQYIGIFNDIKNGNMLDFKIKKNNIYGEIKKMRVELQSEMNYIGRLVYKKLGNNYGKISSTMIGSIIAKAYAGFTSYYALKKLGHKCNIPKYLPKNGKYNLKYAFSESIQTINKIKIFTSDYIKNNYEEFFQNCIKISEHKYVRKKYLKHMGVKKITKKDHYIVGKKYIKKSSNKIIDSRYIEIDYFNKIKKLDISSIEIKPENGKYKICIIHKTSKPIINNSVAGIKLSEMISIDMGMKNLMVIYNPTGKQHIINGSYLSNLNDSYIKYIGNSQKTNDNELFYNLQNRRNNKINHYFNLIVKWMEKTYIDKKLIIIGCNKEWKKGTNMGTLNNMRFNKIPYMKLINKIKNKFEYMGKQVQLTEESYTSKCDGLALEKICFHEEYSGKRIRRGLYESGLGILINADLNGAINIMRKKVSLQMMVGKELENPVRINIFREVEKKSRPAKFVN